MKPKANDKLTSPPLAAHHEARRELARDLAVLIRRHFARPKRIPQDPTAQHGEKGASRKADLAAQSGAEGGAAP